jgi:hypothetical protein
MTPTREGPHGRLLPRASVAVAALALALSWAAAGAVRGTAAPVAPIRAGSPTVSGPAAVERVVEPEGRIEQAADLVARVDGDRALTDVRRLSGDLPLCEGTGCARVHNRLTGTQGTALALEYIIGQTAGLPFVVEEHGWAKLPWIDRNLVLKRTGVVTPSEEIVIIAHADGVATCPDGRCPAADDNASGVAALLELARALEDTPTARSLTLLFSTGEEQNVLGVTAYLATLSQADLDRIRAVVNLDMVGWDGNADRVMELYHGAHEPSLGLASAMLGAIVDADLDLVPRLNPGCG